jgi:hypothetical protein
MREKISVQSELTNNTTGFSVQSARSLYTRYNILRNITVLNYVKSLYFPVILLTFAVSFRSSLQITTPTEAWAIPINNPRPNRGEFDHVGLYKADEPRFTTYETWGWHILTEKLLGTH